MRKNVLIVAIFFLIVGAALWIFPYCVCLYNIYLAHFLTLFGMVFFMIGIVASVFGFASEPIQKNKK